MSLLEQARNLLKAIDKAAAEEENRCDDIASPELENLRYAADMINEAIEALECNE